jgi:hypothetical protein
MLANNGRLRPGTLLMLLNLRYRFRGPRKAGEISGVKPAPPFTVFSFADEFRRQR